MTGLDFERDRRLHQPTESPQDRLNDADGGCDYIGESPRRCSDAELQKRLFTLRSLLTHLRSKKFQRKSHEDRLAFLYGLKRVHLTLIDAYPHVYIGGDEYRLVQRTLDSFCFPD